MLLSPALPPPAWRVSTSRHRVLFEVEDDAFGEPLGALVHAIKVRRDADKPAPVGLISPTLIGVFLARQTLASRTPGRLLPTQAR